MNIHINKIGIAVKGKDLSLINQFYPMYVQPMSENSEMFPGGMSELESMRIMAPIEIEMGDYIAFDGKWYSVQSIFGYTPFTCKVDRVPEEQLPPLAGLYGPLYGERYH